MHFHGETLTTWRLLPSLLHMSQAASGRCFHSAVVHGDGMYVFGGQQQRTSTASVELAHAARSCQMYRLQLGTTPACTLASDGKAFRDDGELCDLELVLLGHADQRKEPGEDHATAAADQKQPYAAPSIASHHDIPGPLHCHACVVAARSPVLREMILSAFPGEANAEDAAVPLEGRRFRLELTEAPSREAVGSFVDFLYCDRIPEDSLRGETIRPESLEVRLWLFAWPMPGDSCRNGSLSGTYLLMCAVRPNRLRAALAADAGPVRPGATLQSAPAGEAMPPLDRARGDRGQCDLRAEILAQFRPAP